MIIIRRTMRERIVWAGNHLIKGTILLKGSILEARERVGTRI